MLCIYETILWSHFHGRLPFLIPTIHVQLDSSAAGILVVTFSWSILAIEMVGLVVSGDDSRVLSRLTVDMVYKGSHDNYLTNQSWLDEEIDGGLRPHR